MKRVLFLLLYFGLTLRVSGSNRFNPDQLKSVLRIETSADSHGDSEIGTGFLVVSGEGPSAKLLLITNKHMVGDWNYIDANIANYKRDPSVERVLPNVAPVSLPTRGKQLLISPKFAREIKQRLALVAGRNRDVKAVEALNRYCENHDENSAALDLHQGLLDRGGAWLPSRRLCRLSP